MVKWGPDGRNPSHSGSMLSLVAPCQVHRLPRPNVHFWLMPFEEKRVFLPRSSHPPPPMPNPAPGSFSIFFFTSHKSVSFLFFFSPLFYPFLLLLTALHPPFLFASPKFPRFCFFVREIILLADGLRCRHLLIDSRRKLCAASRPFSSPPSDSFFALLQKSAVVASFSVLLESGKDLVDPPSSVVRDGRDIQLGRPLFSLLSPPFPPSGAISEPPNPFLLLRTYAA